MKSHPFSLLAFASVLCLAAFAVLSWRHFWGLFHYVPQLDRLSSALRADPLLIEDLREQNQRLAANSDEWTVDQDRLWMTERLCGAGPLQRAVMRKPGSRRLREVLAASGGLVSHALLIDAKGRVAAEPYPSYNFDQARKPKFYYTFRLGPDARDVSWVERSADGSHVVCWRAQTMVDPVSRLPIGALALEVSYEKVGFFGCREQPVHTKEERATNRVDSAAPP